MSKKFIAVIILLVVIGVARHYNSEVAASPSYQNQVEQGVKAFKVNESSKI